MSFIIYPPQNPIAFVIFNHPIYWYGIIITTAIFIGITFSYLLVLKKFSKKEAETFLDFFPFVIIFSIIGARLFYILGNTVFYFKNPLEIIMINHGGLSIWGGLFFGISSFIFFCKKYKTDALKIFDILALSMPLCQAIGRWGNYCNQEAYGRPSDFFIKLYVDFKYRNPELITTEYYHPAFLYESILNLLLFFLLVFIFFKFKLKKGTIFYLYLIFYSIIRIFVESFRIDSVLYLNNFPVASVISFVVLIISLILLLKNKNACLK